VPAVDEVTLVDQAVDAVFESDRCALGDGLSGG
jgi:hypothetical protein